jgi:hypothetical protein
MQLSGGFGCSTGRFSSDTLSTFLLDFTHSVKIEEKNRLNTLLPHAKRASNCALVCYCASRVI